MLVSVCFKLQKTGLVNSCSFQFTPKTQHRKTNVSSVCILHAVTLVSNRA